MPSTTNFGWTTPADTDLVKDGAAAIRTLGNGIDTSFVDLKGGTTGQILSKNSNTDLDFTWTAPTTGDITGVTAGTGISGGGTSGDVTITNSMATAIDAKGDLIAGTGADAFSRLAVGTNGQTLVADSSTATGLKWAAPSAGSLTKITTATLGSNTSAWDISSCFTTTYDNYLVRLQFVSTGNTYLRFRTSGGVQTTGYVMNQARIHNGGISGTDVETNGVYLISGTDADGDNGNWVIGELIIGRVGINNQYVGNVLSRMQAGLGGQVWLSGGRINTGSSIELTGFRLLTSSGNIYSNSTLTVYGLEK